MPRITNVLLLSLFLATGAMADDSALSLFDKLEHDFGQVERGKPLTHAFVLTNHTPRELRIRRTRVSCSCTKVNASNDSIPPGGTARIEALMDTAGFEGSKSVTIHVELDRPHRAEVPLRLSCLSLGAVATQTSQIDLGVVASGSTVVKRMNLDFAGNTDWKITSVDFGNPHLSVEVQEVSRGADKVRYELKLTLLSTAPAGLIEDRVRVHTNDVRSGQIVVLARGMIQGKLTAAPDVLRFGPLVPGQKVTRSLVLRSTEPFRVTRVDKTQGMFEIRSANDPKTTQLVVVTLTCPENAGQLTDHLEFVTDLAGEPIVSVAVLQDEATVK